MATFEQKLSISIGSALLFALINLPFTYQLTDSLLPIDLYNNSTNCPTNMGLIVHALVFFIITFLTMGNPYDNTGVKLKHSIYGTLIFFLIASPAIYALVGSVFGSGFASSQGCPTLAGVILHTIVYCMVLMAVMYLPERNK